MKTIPRSEPGVAAAEPHAGLARRLGARAHLVLPGALTALYAFRAGGFFPLWTGLGAVIVCLLLVLRITLADRPLAGWSRASAVAGLGASALASWTLVSSGWSGAPERALLEFDRALLYAAVLVLMATAPRRPGDLALALRWVGAALAAACLAGLASRVAPDVFPISSRYLAQRLSFPLTYWNAMGMAAALATVLALHQASDRASPRAVRIVATGALPLTAAALYFTFSRGGIVACVLGVVAYAAFAPSRRLAFTAAAAALPVAGALVAAWRADALATPTYFAGPGIGQGHRVALVLAACALAAAGLRALLGRAERRALRRPLPPVERSTAIGVAALAVLLLGSAATIAGVPGAIADEVRTFSGGGFYTETRDARQRLLQVSSSGRTDLWGAALDAFSSEPLHGRGAGTYQLVWQERRHPAFLVVTDGHSLYLEMLAELGLVGLLALALALLTPVAVALRRLRGPERQAHAAFLAAGLALLCHAGVDWDWEMPALFAWYFGVAGVVLARPAGQAGRGLALGRLPRVVAGLACLVLAVTPALVAGSQSRLEQALGAFDRGDCRAAVDSALGALEVLPRPEAHETIGYCDLRAGQAALALQAMQAAVRRDPDNWRYRYGLAVAQAIAGKDPRAAARLAVRRNPQEPIARSLARAMDASSAAARYRAAARAPIPGD